MVFCKLKVENLTFSYGREKIFQGISFQMEEKDILIIKGPNGSGKSTLLKVLSGILSPDNGRREYYYKDKNLEPFEFYHYFGFCSVEQNLYEELTVFENLNFLLKVRGFSDNEKINDYLNKAGISQTKNKPFKNLSSGMKQRVKLISSILHNPVFLFLDEPGTNLDEKGFEFLSNIIKEQSERGICIVASNNEREFEYGNKEIELGK